MKNNTEQFNKTALTGLRQFATLRAKQSRISLPFLTLTEYDCFRRGPSCKCEGLRLFYLEKKNMRKLSKMKRSRMEISGQNLGTVKEPLINSAAHLAVPFPSCISCKFFDLPPVNLQNLQERLTKNSLAS